MLKVLHWESLEARRKNTRLSLLYQINTGHVDITIDQCLQRSDPRTWEPSVFVMQGQTTRPFAIPFSLRHTDSGIGSPHTFRPPHAQRHSGLVFVPQYLPANIFFMRLLCTSYTDCLNSPVVHAKTVLTF